MQKWLLVGAVVLGLGLTLAPSAAADTATRSGALAGVVLDGVGRPVPAARVQVEIETPNGRLVEVRTETDRRGRFGFRRLPIGHAKVRAAKRGVGRDRAVAVIRPDQVSRVRLVLH